MKALIIENEYEVDYTIKALLKDNPTLFESVNEQIYCNHKSLQDVSRFFVEADTIVVASTFMYKDQLEEYVDAFIQSSKQFTFFIHQTVEKLNDFRHCRMKSQRHLRLHSKIVQLYKKSIIFDFHEDSRLLHDIDDNLNIMHKIEEYTKRAKYCYFPLLYSEKHDLFYTEDRHDLNDQLQTFKINNDEKE